MEEYISQGALQYKRLGIAKLSSQSEIENEMSRKVMKKDIILWYGSEDLYGRVG